MSEDANQVTTTESMHSAETTLGLQGRLFHPYPIAQLLCSHIPRRHFQSGNTLGIKLLACSCTSSQLQAVLLCDRQRVGAKIQCSSCYTAYHPLCARIAGLYMNMVDTSDGQEEGSLRLISYCPKHCTPHPETAGGLTISLCLAALMILCFGSARFAHTHTLCNSCQVMLRW